jgi:hypothetical protein
MWEMTCMNGMFSTIICPTAMGKEEVRLSVTWQSTVDSRNICESKCMKRVTKLNNFKSSYTYNYENVQRSWVVKN